MTEREFDNQRKTIARLRRQAKEHLKKAVELEHDALSWELDLLNAANQEPWWGEAND